MELSRTLYTETVRRVAIAAATYVIQGAQLDAGDVLTIQSVSTTNEVSNNKDVTWGFRVGSRDVWVHTIEGASDNEYESWVGPVTIPSGCRVLFKVLSPAAGDITVVTVVGYIDSKECNDTPPPQ